VKEKHKTEISAPEMRRTREEHYALGGTIKVTKKK
jgi:hypothetical protein